MGREVAGIDAFDVVGVIELDDEVVVVEVGTGSHLHLFRDGLSDGNGYGVPLSCQRVSVNGNLGSSGIGDIREPVVEIDVSLVGHFGFVGHVDGEACRFVVGHIAHRCLVCPDARAVYFYRFLVEHRSRAVELRPAFVLVGLVGGTAPCAEHEAAVLRGRAIDVGAESAERTIPAIIVITAASFHVFEYVVCDVLEEEAFSIALRVAVSHHGVHCSLYSLTVKAGAIDIHDEVRLAGGCQREASFLGVTLAHAVVIVVVHFEDRGDGET